MILKEFLRGLEKEIKQEIARIESAEKDHIKRLYSCAKFFLETNARLKEFIVGYEFTNEKEEIYFFKCEKPRLSARLCFYCEAYNIEMERPVGGPEVQREYLYAELGKLQDYIERNHEFYSYYRLGMEDNDVNYFTRGKLDIGRRHLEAIISERDPRYSTNYDYKLARIQANEQLEILLKSQLDELERSPDEAPKLSWATTKAFLIELLYALDSYRAFGRTPLKFVVKVFEKLFGIDMGNYTSEFSKMKDRDNPTPALDALKTALLRRMRRTEE